MPPATKVLIIGGGVIGLSLAWQLRRREITVTVTDGNSASPAPRPSLQASQAAAGMLAVEDPGNPPELLPMSRYSRSLYDDFLADIQHLSGLPVPFQTHRTLQTTSNGSIVELAEQSLDPRQLWSALRLATERLGVQWTRQTSPQKDVTFDAVVHTRGAWSATQPEDGSGDRIAPASLHSFPITPRKGQMLRVSIPPGLRLREVHRAEHVYVVPRLHGPQAGSALIGATVEDAGFDPTLTPAAAQTLREAAAALVPALADERLAPTLESWAGFRPATPDALPLLGELPPSHPQFPTRHFVATGHYRNGILLAPATAVLLADLIEGNAPQVSLDLFSSGRFSPAHRASPTG